MLQLDELRLAIGSPVGAAGENQQHPLAAHQALERVGAAVLILQFKGWSGLADRDPGGRTLALGLDERFEQRRVDLLARRVAAHELGQRALLLGGGHMRRARWRRVLRNRLGVVFGGSYGRYHSADDYRQRHRDDYQRLPNPLFAQRRRVTRTIDHHTLFLSRVARYQVSAS